MNQPAFLDHITGKYYNPSPHSPDDFRIKLLDNRAHVPERAHNSAGYDIRTFRAIHLPPHQPVGILVGFASEFPDCYVAKVFGRSGLAAKGITPLGGVIDADYRGEWRIIMLNTTDEGYDFEINDKIAQVVFMPITRPELKVVGELNDTERGTGGGGSTGR